MFCFKKVVVSESVLKTYTGIFQGAMVIENFWLILAKDFSHFAFFIVYFSIKHCHELFSNYISYLVRCN